jgi:hypothetical protein
MRRLVIFFLAFSFVLVNSCRKCPSEEQLQGTWIEQGGNDSKLIFSGDTFYFIHLPAIDSLSYTLDSKHLTIRTAPLKNTTTAGRSYQLDYHKKKKILTVMGLFPSAFEVSKSYYKKQ